MSVPDKFSDRRPYQMQVQVETAADLPPQPIVSLPLRAAALSRQARRSQFAEPTDVATSTKGGQLAPKTALDTAIEVGAILTAGIGFTLAIQSQITPLVDGQTKPVETPRVDTAFTPSSAEVADMLIELTGRPIPGVGRERHVSISVATRKGNPYLGIADPLEGVKSRRTTRLGNGFMFLFPEKDWPRGSSLLSWHREWIGNVNGIKILSIASRVFSGAQPRGTDNKLISSTPNYVVIDNGSDYHVKRINAEPTSAEKKTVLEGIIETDQATFVETSESGILATTVKN